MSAKYYSLCCMVLCTLLIGSCSKEAPTENQPIKGLLNAKVEGKPWEFSILEASYGATTKELYIRGQRTNGVTTERMNLKLRDVTGPGTYWLGATVDGYCELWIGDVLHVTCGPIVSGVYGQVIVTGFGNGRVAGNFDMHVLPFHEIPNYSEADSLTRRVTDGSFDVPLTTKKR